MYITNNYLTNKKIIKHIKDAFFKTGHATLLKHLYPDDKQRKAIRQKYIQTIIENIFNQISINAQDISTFSIVEYQMIDPLTYRYKKYGGQKNYQRNGIEPMVKKYDMQTLQHEIRTTLNQTKKMMKNDTIPISKAYANIVHCIENIQRYQHKHIKNKNEKKNIQQYIQENTEYNIHSGMKYTNTYINYTSLGRLHIQNIEQQLPQEVQTMFSNRYNEIEKIKDKILQYILTRRVNTHGQAGGKLDRLSQEFLKQKFGVYTGSPEQIDALLDMLTENLYEIIITDLNIETNEYMLLGNDRERLKIYIPKYIQHMRQNITLQGKSSTYELLS